MKKTTKVRAQKCDPCRGTGRADGIGDPHGTLGTATCLACSGRGKVHTTLPDPSEPRQAAKVDRASLVQRPDRPAAEALADALVAAVEAIVRCGDGREPDGTLEARARRLFTARKAVVEAIAGFSERGA